MFAKDSQSIIEFQDREKFQIQFMKVEKLNLLMGHSSVKSLIFEF